MAVKQRTQQNLSSDLLASCRELRESLDVAMRFLHSRHLILDFARELDRAGVICGVEARADAAIRSAEGKS